MTWRLVSNILIIKNKVTNGMAWHHVSHGVSRKRVFNCSKSVNKNFLKDSILVVQLIEAIKTILSLLCEKKFTRTKKLTKQKSPNKKRQKQLFFTWVKTFNRIEVACLHFLLFYVCEILLRKRFYRLKMGLIASINYTADIQLHCIYEVSDIEIDRGLIVFITSTCCSKATVINQKFLKD